MARILHTADWHLGARLVDQERGEEHRKFLAWLLSQVRTLEPDLLIVAGDIFDGVNPPQSALQQYYAFLAAISALPSTQVLILGGNHDSALTLHAPRDLLRALRIRVVGSPPEAACDAILELEDAIVCAIPFLRERDVRRAAPGQSYDQVAAEMREGVARHYRQLLDHAGGIAGGRPMLATGHLTAVGGVVSSSERRIGSLGAVAGEIFAGFDYVALGHLHRPQCVGGNRAVHYSGSPVALSFDEAEVPKQVMLVETTGGIRLESIPIPCARHLVRLRCALADLRDHLAALPSRDEELPSWIELTVEDGASHPDLEAEVRSAAPRSKWSILKLVVPRDEASDVPASVLGGRTLAELEPEEVFVERLRREGIESASEQGRELLGTFRDLLARMHNDEHSPPAPATA